MGRKKRSPSECWMRVAEKAQAWHGYWQEQVASWDSYASLCQDAIEDCRRIRKEIVEARAIQLERIKTTFASLQADIKRIGEDEHEPSNKKR